MTVIRYLTDTDRCVGNTCAKGAGPNVTPNPFEIFIDYKWSAQVYYFLCKLK